MSIRARLARSSAAVAGAAGLALVLIGSTASPASAYQPDSSLVTAINNKRSSLPQSLIYGNFFWVDWPAVGAIDPDGLPGPDGTPDGHGAFQFYAGQNGLGAIYAHQKYGYLYAQTVYGSILASWAGAGYETGKGYPMSDEYDATSYDVQSGCPAGTVRVQRFQRWDESTNKRACWSPNFNAPSNVVWTR